MAENKNIYSLEDVRIKKTEEAIEEIRKTVGRDKEFKKYLERYLSKDKLNDLFDTLWRKKDFKKIQKINKLFNRPLRKLASLRNLLVLSKIH